MGHGKNFNKVNVQKEHLKKIFVSMLETNIAIMKLQITLTDKEEEIKGLKKFIKESEKAINIINSVVHYEILISLYNTFINKKETYFVTLCKTINNKKTIVRWDRTKKGFQEFVALEEEAKAKSKQEYEKKMEESRIIQQAREQGKRVEMVYVDGKLQPRIVDEQLN